MDRAQDFLGPEKARRAVEQALERYEAEIAPQWRNKEKQQTV